MCKIWVKTGRTKVGMCNMSNFYKMQLICVKLIVYTVKSVKMFGDNFK